MRHLQRRILAHVCAPGQCAVPHMDQKSAEPKAGPGLKGPGLSDHKLGKLKGGLTGPVYGDLSSIVVFRQEHVRELIIQLLDGSRSCARNSSASSAFPCYCSTRSGRLGLTP